MQSLQQLLTAVLAAQGSQRQYRNERCFQKTLFINSPWAAVRTPELGGRDTDGEDTEGPNNGNIPRKEQYCSHFTDESLVTKATGATVGAGRARLVLVCVVSRRKAFGKAADA